MSFHLFPLILDFWIAPQKQKTSESIPKSYMTGVAKEAGKETVEHLSQSQDFQQTANNLEQNAEQKYDDAKAKAQVRNTSLDILFLPDVSGLLSR